MKRVGILHSRRQHGTAVAALQDPTLQQADADIDRKVRCLFIPW